MSERLSKQLAYVLRHAPHEANVTLDAHGWVDAAQLVAGLRARGWDASKEAIDHVVRASDKQRFEQSDDGLRIRARQGHSVAIDLNLPPVVPPRVLFHGTVARFLDAIRREGLVRGERHHVHLSATQETARIVGARRGKPVILEVDAAAMDRDGHVFHLTDNGVFLTLAVPASYLRF